MYKHIQKISKRKVGSVSRYSQLCCILINLLEYQFIKKRVTQKGDTERGRPGWVFFIVRLVGVRDWDGAG